jgi:hypothetical protein
VLPFHAVALRAALHATLHATRGAHGAARSAGLSHWCGAKLDHLASCSAFCFLLTAKM